MGIGVLRLVHKTYSALGGVIERFGGAFPQPRTSLASGPVKRCALHEPAGQSAVALVRAINAPKTVPR